jgi:hypothetical protein
MFPSEQDIQIAQQRRQEAATYARIQRLIRAAQAERSPVPRPRANSRFARLWSALLRPKAARASY